MLVEDRIEQIIEPAVCELGFAIVRIQLSGVQNPRLQIMAEPIGSGNMTVDHCATISRAVSALLDVEEPISGNYTLEVSSPGIDRPLVKLRDFERFVGSKVRVESKTAVDGRKRFLGELYRVNDNTVTILIEDNEWVIPYCSIQRAKLVNSSDQSLRRNISE